MRERSEASWLGPMPKEQCPKQVGLPCLSWKGSSLGRKDGQTERWQRKPSQQRSKVVQNEVKVKVTQSCLTLVTPWAI